MNEGDFTERMIAMQPRLYRVSEGILSWRADQEDAVQSCLERAWRKLPTLRDDAILETWVTRILINEWEDVMDTQDYIGLFFPFEPLSVIHHPNGSSINTSDKNSMAIMMTYMNQPEGMVAVFRDWAFTLVSAFLYYKDKELGTNPKALELYRQGMEAFDGSAPTYHIELRDKPTLVWDFHSLMMGIKMVLSFRLTDDQHPLRLCDQCQKVFIAKRADSRFCSPECRKKWTASHDKESS